MSVLRIGARAAPYVERQAVMLAGLHRQAELQQDV